MYQFTEENIIVLHRTLALATALLTVGFLAGAQAPSHASRGDAYVYGGLYANGVAANFIFNGYAAPNGVTGRLNWITRSGVSLAVGATNVVFDSPTHVTMTGTVLYNLVPATYTVCMTKPGVGSQWGTIGLRVVSAVPLAPPVLLYSTGMNADGSVTELPAYSSGGFWVYLR